MKKNPPNHTYIIAEIGQNHNGSIELAKKLIDMAAMPIFDEFGGRQLKPVDAVKFCKRDLSEELTDEEAARPYTSPHSFGKTYGEHRQKLELDYAAYKELEKYARQKGLDFIVTLCSPKTIKLLRHVKLDYIKVASRDLTNIPLLEKLAQTKIPIILSRGMSDGAELDRAIKTIKKYHSHISILHCISEYPAHYENLDLLAIHALQKKYPTYTIGYSDHSIGIMAPVLAVGLGARIIEKHVTLNHRMKGSDQAGSLEADGLWRMVRDIRNAELSTGEGKIVQPKAPTETINRLRRSLAISINLAKGDTLTEKDLIMLSPGNGLQWEDRKKILGKKAKDVIKKNTLLALEMFLLK